MMIKPTKVWFEDNVLWYDAVIDGITPCYIELNTKIEILEFDGRNVYVKGKPFDAVISDLDDKSKTRVDYSSNAL